ncbi:hypothetical protein K2173_005732 [Erythroxylum novogranatense]|uniref:Protein kinase domain-containing protein n=1 Tax=Erythroxylum novogranatense TaxID=1862640 RepID=A0AAV8SQL6_9ROSI|nr:hypothetical protein K2173_005732 [Erythroxylum novogranatense]
MVHYMRTGSVIFLIILHLLIPCNLPFSFNITRFDSNANDIIYEGDAIPTVVGAIELINMVDYLCRVGHATYSRPIRLWDSSTRTLADFTTHFSFTIDTQNATKYGHGIAFFLAPVGYTIPPNSAGGFLGFDTFANPEWDPPMQHVGINNNSLASMIYAKWDVESLSDKAVNVWITYNATTKNLFVQWDNPVVIGNYTNLSHQIDLAKVLPEKVVIGFSAATGQYGERSTVNSWEFTSSNLDSKEPTKRWKVKLYFKVLLPSCLLVFVLAVGIGWFVIGKRMGKKKANVASLDTYLERGALPKRFCYQELVTATQNFADDRKLGQGGSGLVYRGTLIGRLVAVKKVFAGSEHLESLFINEVKIISQLRHRNLVQFIGWCHDKKEFLLVYEFMPNGSLDAYLFGKKRALPWNKRYKIAQGLASALRYLHEDAEHCVLHRDVKPDNIFLSEDFTTKLGDFGISKLLNEQMTTEITNPVGTNGYMAPEYQKIGRASKESDMFSFGVVALEIASGERNYKMGDHMQLVKEVWTRYKQGNMLDEADERLKGHFEWKEMQCMMILGLLCTNPIAEKRPSAGEVIKFLNHEEPLPELPAMMHDPLFDLPLPYVDFEEHDSNFPKYATN